MMNQEVFGKYTPCFEVSRSDGRQLEGHEVCELFRVSVPQHYPVASMTFDGRSFYLGTDIPLKPEHETLISKLGLSVKDVAQKQQQPL